MFVEALICYRHSRHRWHAADVDGCFLKRFRQHIIKRRQGNEVVSILVSMWLSPRPYLYFVSQTLPSPALGFRPHWTRRLWWVQGSLVRKGWCALCHQHTYLYLACPTSLNSLFYLGDLISPDIELIVMGAKKLSSFPPLPSHCSPFWSTRLTLATGPVVPESRGFNNALHSQHCYIYLGIYAKFFRPSLRCVRYTMLLIIPTYRLWLSAVPCSPFFGIYGLEEHFPSLSCLYRTRCRGGYGRPLLNTP